MFIGKLAAKPQWIGNIPNFIKKEKWFDSQIIG